MEADLCLDNTSDDFAHSAAQRDQHRILAISHVHEFVSRFEYPKASSMGVADVNNLDLCLHYRTRTRGVESSGLSGDSRRITCCGNDRRLLGGHRHHDVGAVDGEIRRQADGHSKDADGILDHLIGLLDGQSVIRRERVQRACFEAGTLCGDGASLRGWLVSKLCQPAVVLHCVSCSAIRIGSAPVGLLGSEDFASGKIKPRAEVTQNT